jgi:recombination associated protein RdgC
VLLTLGGEDKLLPGSVVNDALSAKLDHIRETEGRNPGGRERKRIKDEVLTDLLPRAFARSSRCSAYLDLQLGWAIVDSSSRKNAENFVSAVREALGSFPAVPVNAESSPRALMTAWIAGEPLPDGFVLGDECELRDPVDSGAIVKCRRQELEADEVREHLKCGKQAFQLALIFEERLSFVLGEDLVIRKLKFLETVTESLEQGERDSQRDEVDAVFVLMSGELRILLKRLEEIFSFSRAEA